MCQDENSSLLLESHHLFNEDNSSLSPESHQLFVEEIFKPPKHQVDANQTENPNFSGKVAMMSVDPMLGDVLQAVSHAFLWLSK